MAKGLVWILVMIDRDGLVVGIQDNSDHVDAAGDVAAFQINSGHTFDAIVFAVGEHGFWRAEVQTDFGFDFDENCNLPILSDEIDFAEFSGEVLGDNGVTFFD